LLFFLSYVEPCNYQIDSLSLRMIGRDEINRVRSGCLSRWADAIMNFHNQNRIFGRHRLISSAWMCAWLSGTCGAKKMCRTRSSSACKLRRGGIESEVVTSNLMLE